MSFLIKSASNRVRVRSENAVQPKMTPLLKRLKSLEKRSQDLHSSIFHMGIAKIEEKYIDTIRSECKRIDRKLRIVREKYNYECHDGDTTGGSDCDICKEMREEKGKKLLRKMLRDAQEERERDARSIW